eukprot:gene23785-30053_t
MALFLAQHGADLTIPDNAGHTPLQLAKMLGLNLVEKLQQAAASGVM